MKINSLLIVTFSIIFYSCRPAIEITTDQDPDFKLSDFKTFGFVTEDTVSTDRIRNTNSQELGLIKDELRSRLEAKGLNYSDQTPDLAINIGIVVDDRVQTRTTNIMSDPPQYMGQRRYTWRAKEVPVGTYQYGTVTIHLINREADELVWLGVGESIIPESQERLDQKIKDGISELISRIPL